MQIFLIFHPKFWSTSVLVVETKWGASTTRKNQPIWTSSLYTAVHFAQLIGWTKINVKTILCFVLVLIFREIILDYSLTLLFVGLVTMSVQYPVTKGTMGQLNLPCSNVFKSFLLPIGVQINLANYRSFLEQYGPSRNKQFFFLSNVSCFTPMGTLVHTKVIPDVIFFFTDRYIWMWEKSNFWILSLVLGNICE